MWQKRGHSACHSTIGRRSQWHCSIPDDMKLVLHRSCMWFGQNSWWCNLLSTEGWNLWSPFSAEKANSEWERKAPDLQLVKCLMYINASCRDKLRKPVDGACVVLPHSISFMSVDCTIFLVRFAEIFYNHYKCSIVIVHYHWRCMHACIFSS